ncbi:MAG: lysophospholipase [Pseudomonadota bacterium]
MTESFTLVADDKTTIHARRWDVEQPSLIVQIIHGLGEHTGRYARLAAALNEAGFGVYAHDHRGHGEQAELRGYFSDNNGWQWLIDDSSTVFDAIRSAHDGVPIVVLGHSMGSFVAQSLAIKRSFDLAALVLSGSTWPSSVKLLPGSLTANLVGLLRGRTTHSPLLDGLGFTALNKAFAPTRTESDWLSRDEAEVDKYTNDPLCGGPFTIGLWQDFLSGMRSVGNDGALNRVRSDLPILIMGGEKDPVGGDKGMGDLMTHYAQTGHSRLSIRIYDDARHEMFNETNRDEVTADVINWLSALPVKKALQREVA